MPSLRPSSAFCARCLARRYLSTASPPAHTSSAEAASSISPLPRPSGHAHLTDRALISLSGHDASKFLQGLTTANIPPFSSATPIPSPPPTHSTRPNPPPRAIYSAFLNAQGRIRNDVFIYPLQSGSAFLNGEEGFLIEVAAAEQENLYKWLRRYKLRAKIEMRMVEGGMVGVYGAWDETSASFAASPDTAEGAPLHFSDERAPGFGRRVLRAPTSTSGEPGAQELGLGEGSERVGLEAYTIRRYLLGIPEGQSELQGETALVQESCIDYMGGVDFRKGCYVGQELVIRTQHTGVVRKRVLPVQLYPSRGGDVPRRLEYDGSVARELKLVVDRAGVGGDIVRVAEGAKEKRVGRWLGGVGNVGLALWRLESLEGEFRIRGGGDEGGEEREVRVRPFVPGWWAERKAVGGVV